jgi:hypothetical protein
MFKHFCLQNGVPGAEEFTSEFLVFNGSVAGGVVNGAVTQPATQKLNNEYDYYVTEIRISASFAAFPLGAAAATIGATTYIPIVEAQHLSFQIAADGRTRSLFRLPIPFAAAMGSGFGVPFALPAPPAFSGAETVVCTVANLGNYNPAALAAQLDFSIIVQCAIIKSVALKAFEEYTRTH